MWWLGRRFKSQALLAPKTFTVSRIYSTGDAQRCSLSRGFVSAELSECTVQAIASTMRVRVRGDARGTGRGSRVWKGVWATKAEAGADSLLKGLVKSSFCIFGELCQFRTVGSELCDPSSGGVAANGRGSFDNAEQSSRRWPSRDSYRRAVIGRRGMGGYDLLRDYRSVTGHILRASCGDARRRRGSWCRCG